MDFTQTDKSKYLLSVYKIFVFNFDPFFYSRIKFRNFRFNFLFICWFMARKTWYDNYWQLNKI